MPEDRVPRLAATAPVPDARVTGPDGPAPVPGARVPGCRIVVVGTSGSGKTTLARALASRLRIPHIETDALYWGCDWTPALPEEFRSRIGRATAGESWVFDGNYSKVQDLTWSRADTLIWLDYPFLMILWRLFRRTLRRTIGGEVLWNGNRESLWQQLFTRESLLYWVLTTHYGRRQRYEALLQRPEYAHLRVIRLRSPQETAAWLASLSRHSASARADNQTGAN